MINRGLFADNNVCMIAVADSGPETIDPIEVRFGRNGISPKRPDSSAAVVVVVRKLATIAARNLMKASRKRCVRRLCGSVDCSAARCRLVRSRE